MSGAPEPTLADVLHDLGRAKVHLLLGFIFGLLCGFAFMGSGAAVPRLPSGFPGDAIGRA